LRERYHEKGTKISKRNNVHYEELFSSKLPNANNKIKRLDEQITSTKIKKYVLYWGIQRQEKKVQ
jgi:hypothetical protein